jgi:hypothetical protein
MKPKSSFISPLAEGQIVIIVARWVLVLASLFLILLDAQTANKTVFRFELSVVLLLAVSNFYLVAQVLTKRHTLSGVVYGMGLADLIVITLIVIVQGGFQSNVYTFYFPAMLAFSLAFPAAILSLYIGLTIGVYGLICLLDFNLSVGDYQTLIIRLLMLIAVAVCGSYFAHLESRRHAALESPVEPEPVKAKPAVSVTASQPN